MPGSKLAEGPVFLCPAWRTLQRLEFLWRPASEGGGLKRLRVLRRSYCRTPFLRRNIGYRLGECPAVTAKIFRAIDPFSKRHIGKRLDDSSAKFRRMLEMAVDVF